MGPAERLGMTGSEARCVEARGRSGWWVNGCDRVRGTWLPRQAPASVAGKRGYEWEVTGSEGHGSHATRQPAAENRRKSLPPPTES